MLHQRSLELKVVAEVVYSTSSHQNAIIEAENQCFLGRYRAPWKLIFLSTIASKHLKKPCLRIVRSSFSSDQMRVQQSTLSVPSMIVVELKRNLYIWINEEESENYVFINRLVRPHYAASVSEFLNQHVL